MKVLKILMIKVLKILMNKILKILIHMIKNNKEQSLTVLIKNVRCSFLSLVFLNKLAAIIKTKERIQKYKIRI